MLHPRLQKWLPRMIHPRAVDPGGLTGPEARALFNAVTPGQVAPIGEVRRVEVASGTPARLYLPEACDPQALILFFHGGGFVLGTLDSHEDMCRRIALAAESPVLSVDYPLAPEHPFPAAVDCALEVLQGALAGGLREHGLEVSRVAVAGDSAGGAVAAVLAQDAHKLSLPLQAQALLYPVTDCGFDTPSYREHATGLQLTEAFMRWLWRQYLNGAQTTDDPRAAPLRSPNVSGVAPALVMTVEYDPLRDEGKAYADRLRQAGVTVVEHHLDDMCHAFLNLGPIFEPAREQLASIGHFLGAQLRGS